MSTQRISIGGFSLPLATPADAGNSPAPVANHTNPGRKPMGHSTSEPSATNAAHVSVGGFWIRSDPRPPKPTSPAHQRPPNLPPKAVRPGLRLASSSSEPGKPTSPSSTEEGPWRYWVAVTFADGQTGATMELRRKKPIISRADRLAAEEGISAYLRRPVATVRSITLISRPNSVTGEPEPDIPADVLISAGHEAQPWRYRMDYSTETGWGTSEVTRIGPIRNHDDLLDIRAAIIAHSGHKTVAIESFSVLSAPAPTALRRI